MEDFEFKPLTDGLGFHNKAVGQAKFDTAKAAAVKIETPKFAEAKSVAPKPEISKPLARSSASVTEESARPISKAISDMIASLPPSLDFVEDRVETSKQAADVAAQVPEIEANLSLPEGPRPQIFQPFAREDFKAAPQGPTVGSALGGKIAPAMASAAASPYRERLDESFARAFPHAADRRPDAKPEVKPHAAVQTRESKRLSVEIEHGTLEPVAAHLGAGFLDAMIVTGVGTILLVAIILITHINLWGMLSNAQTDRPTQIHIALLFVSVMQLYLLTARSFFGSSLGEWAFELQLGTDEEQQATVYPLRVAWRTLFVTLTGIFVLPAISHFLGRDLARKVSGLQLFRRL